MRALIVALALASACSNSHPLVADPIGWISLDELRPHLPRNCTSGGFITGFFEEPETGFALLRSGDPEWLVCPSGMNETRVLFVGPWKRVIEVRQRGRGGLAQVCRKTLPERAAAACLEMVERSRLKETELRDDLSLVHNEIPRYAEADGFTIRVIGDDHDKREVIVRGPRRRVGWISLEPWLEDWAEGRHASLSCSKAIEVTATTDRRDELGIRAEDRLRATRCSSFNGESWQILHTAGRVVGYEGTVDSGWHGRWRGGHGLTLKLPRETQARLEATIAKGPAYLSVRYVVDGMTVVGELLGPDKSRVLVHGPRLETPTRPPVEYCGQTFEVRDTMDVQCSGDLAPGELDKIGELVELRALVLHAPGKRIDIGQLARLEKLGRLGIVDPVDLSPLSELRWLTGVKLIYKRHDADERVHRGLEALPAQLRGLSITSEMPVDVARIAHLEQLERLEIDAPLENVALLTKLKALDAISVVESRLTRDDLAFLRTAKGRVQVDFK